MNILVTGGAGFIGSALSKRLKEEGHKVIVLDNFNDYYEVTLKKDRVKKFLDGVELVEGDIRDKELLEEIFLKNKIDVVCHLAAMAGVRFSVENPKLYTDTNIQGMIQLLEVMVKFDCKRIVFASSSSVYGNNTSAPFKESEAADKPESVYGATKRAGELLLHSYFKLHGVQSTSLRFFTVYGPWSRPDMAMLKFAKMMSDNQDIPVFNNGDLRRDFTYIDDIVGGFVLAVDKPLGYEVLNLGGGKPIELKKYIDLIEKELEVEAKREFLPMQPGDVYETYADTSKVKEVLGFETKVSIEEGVEKFVSWFRDYYSKDKAVS